MRKYTLAAAVAAAAAGVVAVPSPAHAADSSAPLLVVGVPTPTWNNWYPEDVTASVSVTDLGFPIPVGLKSVDYTLTGSQTGSGSIPVSGMSASGEITISSPGLTSLTVVATDKNGNSSSQTKTVGIDKQAPGVTYVGRLNDVSPVFTQGEAFALGYTCSDDLTGVARCEGDEQGSAIDTSTLGTHELAVAVADRVGNGALMLKQYEVVAVAPQVLRLAGNPTIGGTARVGERLTATPPAVSGPNGPVTATLAYAWKRDGVAIPGATAASYVAAPADAGHAVAVTVTATAPGFQGASATSAPVTVAAAQSPVATSTVTASFKARKHGKVKLTITVTAPGVTPAGEVTVTRAGKVVGRGSLVNGRVVVSLKKQPAKRLTYVLSYAGTQGIAPATGKVSGKGR